MKGIETMKKKCCRLIKNTDTNCYKFEIFYHKNPELFAKDFEDAKIKEFYRQHEILKRALQNMQIVKTLTVEDVEVVDETKIR